MFIKIERLPGNPTSCIFRCFRSFFTDIICSQSLRRENFTITLSLSFLRRWHASMSRGDTSLPIFLKMVSTLSSNSLFCTLSGIPTTSRHSLQEYWAFSQHCLSIIVCIFFFLTHTFSNNGGSSWLGIKIVIQLWKVHSNPVKNDKKCPSKRLFKSTQTFSDYEPGSKLNKNQYLPGLLMSYYFMQKHNMIYYLTPFLHIKDHKKKKKKNNYLRKNKNAKTLKYKLKEAKTLNVLI